MVSGGCVISGSLVKNSLLFSSVRVHSYSEITNSVILPEVEIGRNVRIRKSIIDRGCTIEEGTVIGEDHDQDRERGFRVTEKGVVLVTPDMLHQTTHEQR
jgi:glucose-1-phosphate adenylyltransferase